MNPTFHPISQQRGATLMVDLMFLLILTIVGLAAVRSTTQQTRMAANMQFQGAAFQGAEAAIRLVVGELRGQIPPPAGANLLQDAINNQTGANPPTRSPSLGDISATATVRYCGWVSESGDSMSVEPGATVTHLFGASASSQYGSTSAASIQEQGIGYSGPSSGTQNQNLKSQCAAGA